MRLFLSALAIIFSVPVFASQAVREKYIVFEDRKDLKTYLANAFPQVPLIDDADPMYANSKSVLEAVWRGYEKVFPGKTKGLPTPQLVIVAADQVEAYIAHDPKNPALFPNLIFVFRSLILGAKDALAGVMAHELTHLIERDFQPRYYRVSGNSEPLGFLQANDEQVQNEVEKWFSLTKMTGPYHIPELNGLPSALVYDGKLFDVIPKMVRKYGNLERAECKSVEPTFPEWRLDLLLKYLSMLDQKIVMTKNEAAKLSGQTQEYLKNLRSCLGDQKIEIVPLLAEATSKSVTQVEFDLADYIVAFESQRNAVDGLLTATAIGTAKVAAYTTNHNLSSYRMFSDEELADDHSVKILREIGYSPTAIEGFFKSFMESQPGSFEQCHAMIASGAPIPYGMISDTHHSPCYRIYHVHELAKWLEK